MCVWTLSLTARCGGPTSINPHLILAVLTTSATARSPASPTAWRVGGRRSRDGCRPGWAGARRGRAATRRTGGHGPRVVMDGLDGASVRPSVCPAGRPAAVATLHFTDRVSSPPSEPAAAETTSTGQHWRHQLWGTGARAPPGAWTCKKIGSFYDNNKH